MIVCAIIVIGFQYYWINSLYKNEKLLITKTSNAVFKETVYEVQDIQVLNDTAFITNALQKVKSINVSQVFSKALQDVSNGMKSNKKNDIFSFIGNKLASTILKKATDQVKEQELKKITATANSSFQSIDSIVLPLNDIKGLFKNKLNNSENEIDLPFEVFVEKNNSTAVDEKQNSNFIYTDKVVIGQKIKHSYYAVVKDYQSHIFNKILPQIIISVCIILFFIISFIFSYQTLITQKQLVVAKNDLISNITHEFKTPITTISVAIEAITKFGVIDDKEMTKEYLQVSMDELNRLNLLVDKVLKLSLFENGKIELKTEKVNVNHLIEEVISNMKPQFDKHSAIINFSSSNATIEMITDKSHLKSVVYNLLDNAIKYCNQQPQINIDLKQIENVIEITVEDNGIGIAPQYQHKIFDKFYRVPQGNTHNAKGYGLGLSYILHIVKMHNGYINVISTINKGSKFCVGLPLTYN